MRNDLLEYCNMLSSENDKIVLFAVRSINEMLKTYQVTWESILLVPPPVPPIPDVSTPPKEHPAVVRFLEERRKEIAMKVLMPKWKKFAEKDPLHAGRVLEHAERADFYIGLLRDASRKGFLSADQIRQLDVDYK